MSIPSIVCVNAVISQWYAVALAAICLLQYFAYVHRMTRIRREIDSAGHEHDLVWRELQEVSSELTDVKRDRAITRFEAQVLREFVSQEDCDKAVRGFLRQFVPKSGDGFAAFLRHDNGRLVVAQSHGLSDAAATFDVGDERLSKLLRGATMTLNRDEVRASPIWGSLSPRDRNKVEQMHLFGLDTDGNLPEVLMATALAPGGLEPGQQIELMKRLLSSIKCSLRDKLQLETQQDQIHSTGARLALRGVIDRTYDSPADMLEEFVRHSAEKSAADRATLYLHTADAAVPLKAFVRCGEALRAGLEDQWQCHEDELALSCVSLSSPRQFSPVELEYLGIKTLVGWALVIPVWQQNRPLGLVCFSRRSRQAFSSGQQSLAAWSGDLLADLIPRVVNQAVVERQARLDGLTQLANRGEFDRQIEQQFHVARRNGAPLSLLMFDLDRFKSINDTYGHQGGDAVLRAAAAVIRDCVRGIRTSDRAAGVRPFVARYGGEEMAVLLQVEQDGARRIGEFIRTRLESQAIELDGKEIHVTTSGGLATYPGDASSPEELIAAADTALYQAKANGRNRLEVVHPALVET